MGYSTYFKGEITLDRALSDESVQFIKNLADGERVKLAKEFKPTPYCLCPWEIGEKGTTIRSLNEEKMYEWDVWLEWILEHVIVPAGIQANGRLYWHGENPGDAGVIFVKNNKVKLVSVKEIPEPTWNE